MSSTWIAFDHVPTDATDSDPDPDEDQDPQAIHVSTGADNDSFIMQGTSKFPSQR